MIISASRRTDIPCYYSDWLFNRLQEKFVLVRNHRNVRQVSRIDVSPDVVDAIVFWSKNPKPMLDKLSLLADYPFYFQFTLNSYSQDIEIGLPKKQEIIETFKTLSDRTAPYRVIWRYDPILLNDKYTVSYHIDNFALLARNLKGFTEKVTISFIDFYPKIMKNIDALNIREISVEEKMTLVESLSHIARENGFAMDTCAEDVDCSKYGVTHAKCIDDTLIERIMGCSLQVAKDKTQRLMCGCVASVDIGAYNSCLNGCLYCYANFSKKIVQDNSSKHDPDSPLLIGDCLTNDSVTERLLASNKIMQNKLFSV
jgi:DNA repair photolyase